MRRAGLIVLGAALVLAGCDVPAPPAGFGDADWPVYGRDQAGTKFSPLGSIDTTNVTRLQQVWTWETGERPLEGPDAPIRGQRVRPGSFEGTPVVISDTMYLSTPYNHVVALDAGTGRELWRYDPRTTDFGQPPNGTGFVHRGIAVWSGPEGRRVLLNSRWRLIALDAATGRPIESFGEGGEIDLTEDLLWPTNPLHYTQTSPPVVFEDLVILGNGVWDGFVYENDPPGNLQAFDVRTGRKVWNLNLIPQEGEPGHETWEDGSAERTGHTNAWAPMVIDEARGVVYLGVGTPSNDYYGGDRRGDNLYAESLLAVNARTGELLWHYQTVHHGLWDYDLPAPPVLYRAQVDGRAVDAVAIVGKTGFVYAFDRVTGEPIWPIEERPVPQSDVPGERASATQPFPTKPPPFARQGVTEDDLVSFTPELRRRALEATRGYRLGGLFTPPSIEGTLARPGIIGGGNWGGAAVDPRTATLFVKATEDASLLTIGPADPETTDADYGITGTRSVRIQGIPVTDPPYGTLTAIDMNAGEIVWRVPAGDRSDLRDHPLLEGLDLPERLGVTGAPGVVATAGGLVFLSGGGDVLYAFHARTGEELWSGQLPARAYATPMSFGTSDGRQLVVIATGGGGAGGTLVAFGLGG